MRFERDGLGRLATITAPDGGQMFYFYDDAGNLIGARNVAAAKFESLWI